jgi:hypothetical protein
MFSLPSLPQPLKIVAFIVVAFLLRGLVGWSAGRGALVELVAIAVVFIIGVWFVFRGTADVIEETTDVLKDRTGLAGGFLQALGTAFPDMIIGVVAALLSLGVRGSDPVRAIDLAILAAAATFGSNIYNILHATWCLHRQNLADRRGRAVPMLPGVARFGALRPMTAHARRPHVREIDAAASILATLTLLTAFAAVSMVLFGRVAIDGVHVTGDLYQLTPAVGGVLFVLCVGVLYAFRKSHRPAPAVPELAEGASYYRSRATARLWADLLLAGVAILVGAEAMVQAMDMLSTLAHLPFVLTGVIAGVIGCFGEMLIVHNFSVNPNGRIGDAVTGVAMDNIVTTLGAALVAILGGIFLGGDSLILIFVIILAGNTLLIREIALLKNGLAKAGGA